MMRDVDLALYKAFDCLPTSLLNLDDPGSSGRRAKIDRIHRYYLKHRNRVNSAREMIRVIRQEWTAGLSPIAAWLMWLAMQTLIKAVVLWLWNYYSRTDVLAKPPNV